MHTLQDITILRDILWKIRITYTKQIRTFFKNETHTKPHVVITDDGYIEIKSHKDLGESINKFKEQTISAQNRNKVYQFLCCQIAIHE